MPFQKTEAVVITSIDYGESDRIVTFYTLDHGKVKCIAKGARKSKKRFVNTLEPFSHVRMGFFKKEQRELVRVDYCDLINPFSGIREDIERIAFGSSFLELLDNLVGEGQKNLKAYILLLRFLNALNGSTNFERSMPLYELRLVSILGYRPHLNACVICQSRVDEDKRVLFSPSKGGVVCMRCEEGAGALKTLSVETIKTFNASLKVESEKLKTISLSHEGASESKEALRAFITYQLGKRLKSWGFLDEVTGKS